MTDDLRTELRHDTLWIWINREARRNALNAGVLAGIGSAVSGVAGDPRVRAVVISGVGEKAFCAGADLTAGTTTFQTDVDEPTTDFGRLARAVRTLGVPLIARINGACVAGGMGLLALCDLAIAAEHARFGLPEVRVGVFPMQVLALLRGAVHTRHVNELCLTGELITARRAAQIGLVNEVVAAADLDAAIDALLAKLRLASPAAVRRGKHALLVMERMAFEEAIAFAEAQIGLCSASPDAQEGLAAFTQKRRPRWAPEI